MSAKTNGKGRPNAETDLPTTNGAQAQGTASKSTVSVGTSRVHSLLLPYVVSGPNGHGELRLRCPFKSHSRTDGPLALNLHKRLYVCHACEAKGTISGLIDFLRSNQSNNQEESTKASANPLKRQPVVLADAQVQKWHKLLMSGLGLGYLTNTRLLTIETILEYEIGWDDRAYRYTLPVRDGRARLVNVRRYSPKRDPKMVNTYGHGSPSQLYPSKMLAESELVLCAGEWDCLLLIQNGIPAITNTGGERTWKPAWNENLTGKVGPVIYDCDEAGRKGSEKPLAGIPGSWAVDLDPDRTDGFDVTDWFQSGRTADELRDFIAQSRPDDDDPILDDDELDPVVDDETPTRPQITVTNAELHQMAEQAEAFLVSTNNNELFWRVDKLSRLVETDSGLRLKPHTKATLKEYLSRHIEWVRLTETGIESARPDQDVVYYLLDKQEYRGIPQLDKILRAPFLSPDGVLITEHGYYESLRIFLAPTPELADLKIPNPTPGRVTKAVAYLRRELFEDFPFKDAASWAHTFCLLITALVREVIPGPTPMFVVDASKTGSGKGLLVNVALWPSIGEPPLSAEPKSDADYGKVLVTLLRAAPSFIFLDNIKGKLGGSALESALTAETWGDRLLGGNEEMRVQIRNGWVATANNLQLTRDMARRCVLIRLVSDMEKPFERPTNSFYHSDLLTWVKANRRTLVTEALVVIKGWAEAGMPTSPETAPSFGSYEAWATVMSGILDFAGIPGFLQNSAEIFGKGAAEDEGIAEFLASWQTLFSGPVTAKAVADEMAPGRLLSESVPQVLARDVTLSTFSVRLGQFLGSIEEARYSKRWVRKATKGGGHAVKWIVESEEDVDAGEKTLEMGGLKVEKGGSGGGSKRGNPPIRNAVRPAGLPRKAR